MMFYMPVRYMSPSQYQVVDDLPLKLFARRKIRAIVKVCIIYTSFIHRVKAIDKIYKQ